VLAEHNVNILDISQTILENMFTMIMRVELLDENAQVAALNQALAEAGKDIGLDIRLQRQDIFDAMHRV
jgi:ACT domain-containing protein